MIIRPYVLGVRFFHTCTPCDCVVKGRKSRFPAHCRSFPLIQAGHRAGGGAEWGRRQGFGGVFSGIGGQMGGFWGSEVRGVGEWALGRPWQDRVAGCIWSLGNMVRMGWRLEQGGSVTGGGFSFRWFDFGQPRDRWGGGEPGPVDCRSTHPLILSLSSAHPESASGGSKDGVHGSTGSP